jgi:hypothetical protein
MTFQEAMHEADDGHVVTREVWARKRAYAERPGSYVITCNGFEGESYHPSCSDSLSNDWRVFQ